MAYGNIVVYGIVVTGLALFVRKNYPFPLPTSLVTLEEGSALRELLRARS